VGRILARLYLLPEQRWTLSTLAEEAAVSLPTLTREADGMVAAGLVLEERVGRTRQLRCNQAARTFEPLRQLLTLTYGPVPVLEAELSGIPGVQKAYICGSWAARHQGVIGPEPADIEVLIVGDPDPDELFAAGERARSRLLRETNIRTVSAQSWSRAQSGDERAHSARDGSAQAGRAGSLGLCSGLASAVSTGPVGGDPVTPVAEDDGAFLRHVLASPLVPLDLTPSAPADVGFQTDTGTKALTHSAEKG
jgi:hypothetical protein